MRAAEKSSGRGTACCKNGWRVSASHGVCVWYWFQKTALFRKAAQGVIRRLLPARSPPGRGACRRSQRARCRWPLPGGPASKAGHRSAPYSRSRVGHPLFRVAVGSARWLSMLMITPPWVTQAASVTSIRIIYSNSFIRVSAQRRWKSAVGSAPSGTKPEPGVIHCLYSSVLTSSRTGLPSKLPKPASRRSCTVN